MTLPLPFRPQIRSLLERNIERLPVVNLSNKPVHRIEFEEPTTGERLLITSESQRGIPGAIGQDVYMALSYLLNLKCGREADVPTDRTVTTRLADLLEIMRMQRGGKQYALVREALDDWWKVRIEGVKVFRGGQFKSRVERVNVFDYMAFDNAREQEQDTIVTVTFNERLLRSIVLDRRFRIIPMDDYLRFNLPTSRRLFRYLDLRRYRGSQAQSSLRMSVAELQRYLPLFTEAPSHVARNLTAVHQELADGGFLSTVPTIVRGRGASNWIVSYEFADSRQDAALEVVVDLEELVTLQLSVLRDLQNAAWYTKIAKVLPPDRVRALVTDIRMHINNGGFEMPVYRRTYSTWAKRAAVELGLKLTEDVG